MANELPPYDTGITFKQKWVREKLNFNNYRTYGNKGDS
jgi:hypothetical protein